MCNWARVDLRRCKLDSTVFAKCNLANVRFDEARLHETAIVKCEAPKASFVGAKLEMAHLDASEFQEADFSKVDARQATFAKAGFQGASFAGASLTESPLVGADLSGTNFEGATLNDCALMGANLTGTRFGKHLVGCMLNEAFVVPSGVDEFSEDDAVDYPLDLSGCDFRDANLERSAFSKAILREADLRSVDFQNADFAQGAVIEDGACVLPTGGLEVDLVGAQLSDANFSASPHFFQGCISVDATTTYSAETRFPDGFDLQGEMTIQVPEPLWVGLQGAALAALAFLKAGQQRKTSRPRS